MRCILCALFVFSASSVALAAPDVVVGDSFTYESKGKSFTQIYRGSKSNGDHVFVVDDAEIVMNASMSFIQRPGTRADPHNGQLALETSRGFKVGASWEVPYTVTKGEGATSTKTRVCSVVAHDPKKIVRAGAFDAYQVDCTVKTPGKGTRYSEVWYDSKTWRSLEHRVGNSKGSLENVLELVRIKLKPR